MYRLRELLALGDREEAKRWAKRISPAVEDDVSRYFEEDQDLGIKFGETSREEADRVFLLQTENKLYIGRKTFSQHWLTGKIDRVSDNVIRPSSLLGECLDFKVAKESIFYVYRSLLVDNCREILTKIKKSSGELLFPFSPLVTGKDVEAAPTGWFWTPKLEEQLPYTEEYTLKETISVLHGVKKESIWDAACSTGDFLAKLESAFPESALYGRDLNASMAARAKARGLSIEIGDAFAETRGPFDVAIFRFLNFDIVTVPYVLDKLKIVKNLVNSGGCCLFFGYSPTHITKNLLETFGFKVEQTLGWCDDYSCFQYYVARC